MVDRDKFGERHVCPACGCKFYDMRRSSPVCPRCGADATVSVKHVAPFLESPEIEEESGEEDDFLDLGDEKIADSELDSDPDMVADEDDDEDL